MRKRNLKHNIKRNMILFLLLLPLIINAQVIKDVTIYQGDSDTLTLTPFSIADTARTYRMGVKDSYSITGTRRIYKASGDGITTTYNALTKKVQLHVAINPSDTWQLTAKTYYYDVEAVSKTDTNKITTVLAGKFIIQPGIFGPFDNTDYLTSDVRYFPVEATNFDEGEFIKKSGNTFAGDSLYSIDAVDSIFALYFTKAQIDSIKNLYYTKPESDSIKALYYLATVVDSLLSLKQNTIPYTTADADSVYKKSELNAGQLDNRYYTETETNNLLNSKRNLTDHDSLSALDEKNFSSLDNKPTTIAGYGITNAYRKGEVDTLLAPKFNTADFGSYYDERSNLFSLDTSIVYTPATGHNPERWDTTITSIYNNNSYYKTFISYHNGTDYFGTASFDILYSVGQSNYFPYSKTSNIAIGHYDTVSTAANMNYSFGNNIKLENTFANWMFGQYLYSTSKGLWAFGGDNTFQKKRIPYHDQIVFWNEPLTVALSDPNNASNFPSRASNSFQNFDTSDSTEYKFGIQKPLTTTRSDFGLWAYWSWQPDGSGGIISSNQRRLFNINNSTGTYDFHFNDYKTDSNSWGNVIIDNGNLEVTNGTIRADSITAPVYAERVIESANRNFITSTQESNYNDAYSHSWKVTGNSVASRDTLPYQIHSFTTAQRDSWTPANGWLFRNSTMNAYQVYESGWQTLASGEWVEANYISKTDTTDYVRYATSTVGYIPYVSRTGMLSNSGIYFDGTNYGIGTTSPGTKLEVAGTGRSFYINSGSNSLMTYQNGSSVNKWTTGLLASTGQYIIYDDVNSLYRMVIENTGKVGINNHDPVDLLDIKYATGVKLTSFRGTTNTAITGWLMYNADGEACYVYPNATQDGIIVSATAP